jgi:hypothetical protein
VSFDVGHRVAVVSGGLKGYYGHVSDRIVGHGGVVPMVGVTLRGSCQGVHHPNPNVRPGKEWFIPTCYLEHID